MRKPINAFLKITFISAVFLFFIKGLHANDMPIQYDSTGSVVSRSFDETKIQSYKADPDFIYAETSNQNDGYESNFISRLLRKLLGISFNEHTATLWEIILYVFAGSIFLLVIWNLLKADKSWFMQRSAKNAKINVEEIELNIHDLDLDALIKEAIDQKQYRKAVRLLYLKSLKELHKKNLIQWSIQKTNSDYLSELKIGALKKSFKNNTLIFEYVWYGDFHIDELLLQKAKASFDSFIREIQAK